MELCTAPDVILEAGEEWQDRGRVAGVWPGAWGQELEAEGWGESAEGGGLGQSRNKREGGAEAEKGTTAGVGVVVWGEVGVLGRSWDRPRGRDSLLWHWKRPLPQPSSLAGQGTLTALG